MRRVTSKSSKSFVARDIVFNTKCMFGGRAPPGPAGELERSQDTLTAVGAIEGDNL